MATWHGKMWSRLYGSGLLLAVLAGCATTVAPTPDIASLPALHGAAMEPLSPAAALEQLAAPDLLAMTPAMRDFADRYVRSARSPRVRLDLLHSSLRSGALHGLEYVQGANGGASEAFESGQANCLAYANLFVAMARYSGLDADYQLLTLRPQFTRFGTRVAVQQHVNVLVRLRDRSLFSIDLDPPPRDTVSSSRRLADAESFALYHNNIAMEELRSDNLEAAFAHMLRALQLSPSGEYLWTNLGVIYSRTEQWAAAEYSYLQALALKPDTGSAMNNLLILHTRAGNHEQVAYWQAAVAEHRERNPYYYVSLGEAAALQGDLEQAVAYYQDAIARKAGDPEFYFSVAQLYRDLQQPALSIEYTEKAIEHAVLMQRKREYEAFLSQLTDPSLALLQAY